MGARGRRFESGHPDSEPGRGRTLATLSLVGICAIWGLTFTLIQDAVERMPTLAFLGYRFCAATVLVTAFSWRALRSLPAAGWRAGLLMGALLTLGYVTQTFALEHTTASNAGFITGLFVVLTPVLGAIFLGQRPGKWAWLAAGASAIGMFALSGGGAGFHPRGDGLAFVCACAFAAHILVTGRAAGRFPATALLAVQLGVVGVVTMVSGAVAGDLVAPPDASVWFTLALTAVVASALGYLVQIWAQTHVSPARTALILAAEPAFAGLFGYVLAGDRLGALGWAGAALILAAITLVDVLPRLRPPRPLPEG